MSKFSEIWGLFECKKCGHCCSIGKGCPSLDLATKLCKIYEDRPERCRFWGFFGPYDVNFVLVNFTQCPGFREALCNYLGVVE